MGSYRLLKGRAEDAERVLVGVKGAVDHRGDHAFRVCHSRPSDAVGGEVDKMCVYDNFDGMNRLTIEIEPEQHRQIKTLATFSGMTIKEFILAKTLNISREGDSEDTTARLLASPTNAKRLRKAVSSSTPEHLVFDSIEDVKNALGI